MDFGDVQEIYTGIGFAIVIYYNIHANIQICVQYYNCGLQSCNTKDLKLASPPENSTVISSGSKTISKKNALNLERIKNGLENRTTL
ncbi:hypothetical protein F8M41_006905 [Gigaspora margarita]|uniref:Uncharacterized protein n=1 Tax=Gigaspora margarita TaxID=4874 RepID=A0A8H3X8A7_GIGMA|nr:hypothetical protein F8M41_006905 [Gigaspora margarita]